MCPRKIGNTKGSQKEGAWSSLLLFSRITLSVTQTNILEPLSLSLELEQGINEGSNGWTLTQYYKTAEQ